MNKVTTINLNGRAYQLEEAGYEALRAYLETASRKLEENPDRDEIMADFEQAIADKCDDRLRGHKDVISTKEIEAIIAAMGPVDAGRDAGERSGAGAAGPAAGSGGAPKDGAPKRLYRIPKDEWLAGVCNGLAAYFNLDVTLMRVIFVLLTILTHGLWALAYIILAIVMPVARTDEERARAHGERPWNAHDFIEEARTRYAEFQKEHPQAPTDPFDKAAWRQWKQDMREWKRDLREELRAKRREWRTEPYAAHCNRAAGIFTGILSAIIGILMTALAALWIYAIWAIVAHGTVFGYTFALGHPLWIPLLFVTLLFYLASLPFRLMFYGLHRHYRQPAPNGALGGIIFLVALLVFFWSAHELFPAANAAWNLAVNYLTTVTYRH
ncbi:MAG TPA: PspC domain-containing protein [Candidatus Paceibacterota bacterium]|nr:PspC domain-containing protein [Candidatus Paceibacterota bacterium]